MFSLLLVAIAFAVPAAAAEHCVDPDDAPPCFATIQEAIDAANPGDTIEIEEGEYSENIVVPADLTGLELEGESGVVIRPPDGTLPGILVLADDVTIEKLTVVDVENESCIKTEADNTTVEHSRVEACGASCILASADHLTVEDTDILACFGEGILVYGNDSTIEETKITRTGKSCVAVFGNGATVYDSEVKNCYLCGICIFGDGALVESSQAKVTLEDGICGGGFNARFFGNLTRNTLLSGIFWNGQATLQGNEIDGAGLHGMELAGAGHLVRYNEVEDSGGDAATDCYLVRAKDSTFKGNEAEDCPDDGFGLLGTGNTLTKNETEGIVDNGFEVAPTATGTVLRYNEAEDSGSLDLCNEGGATTVGNDFDPDKVADADCADPTAFSGP